MRRTLIIAAMLLPLPFAAIPIVSVMVAPAEPYVAESVVVNPTAHPDVADDGDAYEASLDGGSLTFKTGGSYRDCLRASITSIEG